MAKFTKEESDKISQFLNWMRDRIYQANVDAGWHTDLETGELIDGNKSFPIKTLLMHSELSEATEAWRKGLMDDKIPERNGVEVEFADVVIRLLDCCGSNNYDIGGALVDKYNYNHDRADHKIENRKKDGGKKF